MQGLSQVSVSLENTRFHQHKRPSLSMIASFTFLVSSVGLLRHPALPADLFSVNAVGLLRSFAISEFLYCTRAFYSLRHLAQLNVFWRILR
jgi:hypothetical protein